ncbi:DsbA family oxidoreductase [Mesorhizobium sp. CAU 1732]|uniref:DsbA family oxidoreductase n=1 Tax=Mesorhizobium sp. CAU 1732 TaxID=3140358 RepID=UPI0032609137
MSEPIKLVIDVISDVVCPWCFIGSKRLESALAMAEGVEATIHWRPYQLDATIPPAGLPRREYMLAKFDSEERLREIHATVEGLGEVEGIRFNFDAIETSPNTLDAHRLIRWAGSPKSPPGAQGIVVKRLFELFFEEARDIGDRSVLVEAAGDAGMDTALVEALLSSNADVDAVKSEIETIAQMGVRGVPCFLLEGKFALMGAQDPETLADAIKKVAEAKARGELDAPQTA